jgi:arylsulfatase A-like enzyme
MRGRVAGLVVLIAVSAAVVFGCARQARLEFRPGDSCVAPDYQGNKVVFILIDALRADHLPFYGYSKNTAPFMGELAERSIVFERAISASSWTAPSVASIFTSLYPSTHGVITGLKVHRRLKRSNPSITLNRIPDDITTIGEEFEKTGYRTYCISDNQNISEELGFTQGFERFETYQYEGAETVNAVLREWEKDIKESGRYFLYLHYMDPHKPYNERAPWFEDDSDPDYRTINAYDSEIRYMDEKLREMFELFDWEENALVIVVADHGEEFWDHGLRGHGNSLYTEVIRVPFFIYHSEYKETRIEAAVHLLDILPTLAALLNFPQNPAWQGKSLVPLFRGEEMDERTLFSELRIRPGQLGTTRRSILFQGWHYISSEPEALPVSNELYNIQWDFGEKKELSAKFPRTARRLQQMLNEFSEVDRDYSTQEVEIPVDEETLEKLKSLGYVE